MKNFDQKRYELMKGKTFKVQQINNDKIVLMTYGSEKYIASIENVQFISNRKFAKLI